MPTDAEDRPRARVAEARRNRQRLVAAAAESFAAEGERVALDAIARRAGVGIATLYRHFPQREMLVEAVYTDAVERLRRSARALLARHAPAEAFGRWMPVFADWAATKHGMSQSLATLMSSGHIGPGRMRGELTSIVTMFLDAGADHGDLRDDVTSDDVAATLAGVLAVSGGRDHQAQTVRRLNLVLDGLRR